MSNTGTSELTDVKWSVVMEVLATGAMRGMISAHAELNERSGGMLAPLNDLTLFRVCEVLAATLLEESRECTHARDFPKAARQVGQDVLDHLKALRHQRENSGESTLLKLAEKAGVERRRPH